MDLSPSYHVCTKTIFISEGRYGYVETRNVFPCSVFQPILPVWAVKLLRLKGVGIGPRTQTCINWGGPIAMVPCLHQGNIYFNKKLWEWKGQKCIPLVGTRRKLRLCRVQKCTSLVSPKTPLTNAGRQTTPSQESWYRPENGILHTLGWTYHLGTICFFLRQYLYQKEATGMERPEIYSPTRAKTPLTCAGSETTQSQGSRYRPDNRNLRKLGWTYRHGTVFAPIQYLYTKKATGMERPEMYSPSWCKNPSYLCGPSNYSVSRESV